MEILPLITPGKRYLSIGSEIQKDVLLEIDVRKTTLLMINITKATVTIVTVNITVY